MSTVEERQLIGLAALEAATTLLQRIRAAHPTFGLYEAADLQWWWRVPRPTDQIPQLFWFDDAGPVAAAILTDWGDRVALDPIVGWDTTVDVPIVVDRGLAHARAAGYDAVGIEVDRNGGQLSAVLTVRGFTNEEDSVVETWLDADARPPISPLADGYRLATRADTRSRPHHFGARSKPNVEERLRQTSLYRADLDLVVFDADDEVAAYGLFWHDPTTATGLVEPMRTEDAHQRRGLARHVLTTGIDRLAAAGATRIKICYEPDNTAARTLYLDTGFLPDRETVVLRRPSN
jgi:predicted N-acetyltransferase YhbS